ncbi:MAG TPA: hypothetical protein VMV51_07125 [Gemmatimonadaceae bacterium]|nr:hypothetical protein [Gemmatimonadaceae bacterium]
MMPRLPTILGAAAVAFCVGCGALSAPKAQFPNTVAFPTVYALNGAPPATPAGLNFLSGSPVSVDANLQFNVALDIDSAGRIVVYSARKVTNGLTGVIRVGLQTVPGTFDGYTKATKNGYAVDSTLVVSVGQVVAVNVYDQTTCTVYSLGSSYYAKFVVDSINAAQRAIYVELLSDPNCGYVTLTPGIPTK